MRSLVGVEVPGDVLNMPLRHPQLSQILLSVSQTCPEFLQKLTSSRSLRPREELDVEAEPPALSEELQGVDHGHQITEGGAERHEGVKKVNNQLGWNLNGEYVLKGRRSDILEKFYPL